MKQGTQLPMDEVMTYLRSIQGAEYPSVVIYPLGHIHVLDLGDKAIQKFKDADEFLSHIRKGKK
jgi:hypothetical protein